MKLEVTELGPVQRAVKIEVPAEDVTKRFEVAYADLNRRVHIPGFRPGKAPQGLLEQRYAKAIEEDVLRQLLPDYYRRAMKETGFDPVTVDIPEGYSARLETGTVNGPMVIDFPVTLQGTNGRRISTQLGRGGATIRAVTTNGPVAIHRR